VSSSIEMKGLGDVDGWLRHVRKCGMEWLSIGSVRSNVFGRIGTEQKRNNLIQGKMRIVVSYFHYYSLLKQLVANSCCQWLFLSGHCCNYMYYFDWIVFSLSIHDFLIMLLNPF
jgi:hypothetical protein